MTHDENSLKLVNVYLAHVGRKEGQDIWIVDGDKVARDIYPEFIFGGNDMRYCFNPPDEVWIDSRTGVEEYETTLQHELIERRLMKEQGMTYTQAHTEALKLELTLRPSWERRCLNAGKRLVKYAKGQSIKKLLKCPEEKLLRLYRQPVGRYRGASIWIVDGTIVRQEINPDFGNVDSLTMSDFVPPNQFWLDASMSTLEGYFSLFRRKALHKLLQTGMAADDCYHKGLAMEVDERKRQFSFSRRHELLLAPVSYGARERYTG